MQCVFAKTDSGSRCFDVPALRVRLHSAHILPALQLYHTGYSEHVTLSDFRCCFQALSPLVMKRYGSVFITPDERKESGGAAGRSGSGESIREGGSFCSDSTELLRVSL
ncbi:unnamed protein product [Oncorhynchus mykiss]|uniref:Uncharacterized protein n=1 Tax=Oncorhynchus mykiss TaxID=8022 RepID=A0A061AE25_ONCMY|nr:unnamed protein product [Oncorhynchus mykiss]